MSSLVLLSGVFTAAAGALVSQPAGADDNVGYAETLNGVLPFDSTTGVVGSALNVFAGAPLAISPNGDTLLVGDLGFDIIPYDLTTHTAGSPISTGDFDQTGSNFVFSPDSSTAYVSDFGGVLPIDLSTDTTGTVIPGTAKPASSLYMSSSLAMSPDGQTLWLSEDLSDSQGNEVDGRLVPIDLATNTVGTPIALPGPTDSNLVVSEGGTSAYVAVAATDGSASVVPINLSSGQVGKQISGFTGRLQLVLAPGGDTLYVGENGSDEDPEQGRLVPITVSNNHVGSAIVDHGTYSGLTSFAIDPTGCTAYVTSGVIPTTNPIDLSTKVTGTALPSPFYQLVFPPSSVPPTCGGGSSTAPVSTTTTVTSSLNPSPDGGAAVTFQASVSVAGGAAAVGSVKFTGIPGSPVVSVVGGVASSGPVSGLSVGNHTIKATFTSSGTSPAQSTSMGSLVQVVSPPISTTTTLQASSNPSADGASVTFTAQVHQAGGAPAVGSVKFTGLPGSPVEILSGGKASVATSSLSPGSHVVTAKFTSTATPDEGPSSGSLTEVINGPLATTTTVTSSTSSPLLNGTAVFTAHVSVSGGGSAVGTVTFSGLPGHHTSVVVAVSDGVAVSPECTFSAAHGYDVTAKFVSSATVVELNSRGSLLVVVL